MRGLDKHTRWDDPEVAAAVAVRHWGRGKEIKDAARNVQRPAEAPKGGGKQ